MKSRTIQSREYSVIGADFQINQLYMCVSAPQKSFVGRCFWQTDKNNHFDGQANHGIDAFDFNYNAEYKFKPVSLNIFFENMYRVYSFKNGKLTVTLKDVSKDKQNNSLYGAYANLPTPKPIRKKNELSSYGEQVKSSMKFSGDVSPKSSPNFNNSFVDSENVANSYIMNDAEKENAEFISRLASSKRPSNKVTFNSVSMSVLPKV